MEVCKECGQRKQAEVPLCGMSKPRDMPAAYWLAHWKDLAKPNSKALAEWEAWKDWKEMTITLVGDSGFITNKWSAKAIACLEGPHIDYSPDGKWRGMVC